MHGALPALLPPLTLTLTLSHLWKGYLNVHTWTTGKFTNRYVISIVMIPGRVITLVPSPGGGFSTDQRPVLGADCHCAMLSLGLQHCTDAVSKCYALEMRDAGCSGHRPDKWPEPWLQLWSTSSIATCLSPRESLLPFLPLLPASLRTHQAPHAVGT